jgi:hypothetical protein
MAIVGNSLAGMVGDPNGISGLTLSNEKVFGIPSFLWGCVGWIPGVAVVYLVSQDKAETKSAIIGCVVGSLFWAGLSTVRYFVWGGYWW